MQKLSIITRICLLKSKTPENKLPKPSVIRYDFNGLKYDFYDCKPKIPTYDLTGLGMIRRPDLRLGHYDLTGSFMIFYADYRHRGLKKTDL